MVKQHNANRANHCIGLVAQRNAADDKRAGLVGQQIHQNRLARLQHAAHLRVGNHLLHQMPQKLIDRRETQRRQKPLVTLIQPDNATADVHQKHPLADAGEQVEHGARGQLQNSLGIAGQDVWMWVSQWRGRHGKIVSQSNTARTQA